MKIQINATLEASPEEMAVLFREPKAENEATFNIDAVSCTGSTVDKLMQEAAFYYNQKSFGPLKGTGSPQENLKRVLLDVADANGIKF